MTAAALNNALTTRNGRVVYLKYDNFSPFPFTAVSVENTGTYKRAAPLSDWFYGVDEETLRQKLTEGHNHVFNRLIRFKAYDIGQGQIRFAGSIIPNTGADQKVGSYFYHLTSTQLTDLANTENLRFTALHSYSSNGATFYAGIWIMNTGADAKAWWWFVEKTPQEIGSLVTANKARLLDVTSAGNGKFNAVMESCSGDCPSWSWWFDKSFSQMQAIATQNNVRTITADKYPGCGSYCFVSIMMQGTSGSDHGAEEPRLRGFVDLHTHPLSNLGFGGLLVYGGNDVGSILPHDPNCNVDAVALTIDQALGHDRSTHGGWNLFNNGCGNDFREFFIHQFQQATQYAADEPGDARGAPDYINWPVWNDITHQKMSADWIREAYNGGLRVMVALAVNNKTLGEVVTGGNLQLLAGPGTRLATDDKGSADTQIESIKKFVQRHGDFMAIASSSADLKSIVRDQNKLAVILGVEIDAIGNLNYLASTADIQAEIARLYNEGVRYAFPVHVIDNIFGGTAAYIDAFNYSNRSESGQWWELGCNDDGRTNYSLTYSFSPGGKGAYVAAALITIGLGTAALLSSPPNYPQCAYGQRNQLGLTTNGELAIKEMMRHGMLIDLDHMSQNTFNDALSVGNAVPGGYPLMSGHSDVRINGGTERSPTKDQYSGIGSLGGMTGVGSAGFDACSWTMSATRVLRAMDFDSNYPGKQLNTAGIGFGTDTDGLAMGMPNRRLTTLFPSATGDPATMTPGGTNHQQHIFYRDTSGNIQHVFWDPGPAASPPNFSMFGPAVWGTNAAGNPATMLPGGTNNQQHIFYRDTGGNIQHVFWDPGSQMLIHDNKLWGTNAAGDPATMTPGGTNNQQHIFYRDTSGNIQHWFWDAGSQMLTHDNKLWGTNAAGDPATMTPGGTNNQQHIFFRDTSGNIQHWFWDANSGLHGPEIWGTNAAGDPVTMLPGGTNNQQHIFYRDNSNRIQHVFRDAGSGMHGPEVWAWNATGDPATMLPGGTNNQQHIFYRDTSGNIQHVFWDPSSGMHGPEIWGTNAAGNPATMLPGGTNNQQHIFYRNTGGGIWHVFLNSGAVPPGGLQRESWVPETDPQAAASLGSDSNFGEYCNYFRATLPLCSSSPVPGCITTHTTGQKTWNYNNDGVAHYGMLPDFLQDVKTVPGGFELVHNNMMYGAESLYQTWSLAEKQAARVPNQ
jgi:microsomal dipeptidase-like Zn-dependent dipeptidase